MYISVFILKETFRASAETHGTIKGLYMGNLAIVDWLAGCCLVITTWSHIICTRTLLKHFIFYLFIMKLNVSNGVQTKKKNINVFIFF